MEYIVVFLVALLSGLGIGSGGIFVIYLTLINNSEQIYAQYQNLLLFIFASLAAFLYNARKKLLLPNVFLILSFFCILGAFIGFFILNFISEELLKKAFGGLLVIMGLITLIKTFPKLIKNAKKA